MTSASPRYSSAMQQRFRAVYTVEDAACGGHLRYQITSDPPIVSDE